MNDVSKAGAYTSSTAAGWAIGPTKPNEPTNNETDEAAIEALERLENVLHRICMEQNHEAMRKVIGCMATMTSFYLSEMKHRWSEDHPGEPVE